MNSKLRVREALDVLYMQGEDAGKSNYGSATHQIAAVTEAEKAIRQAVGEEMLELVGKDDYSERNGLVGLTHRDETRNELKAELRQKIKQWAALKEPSNEA